MSDWTGEWVQQRVNDLLRQLSFRRAAAYVAVFQDGNATDRQREGVLADLRDYCFATGSTFDKDPIVAARNAGRREAWLRIAKHLALNDSDAERLIAMEVDNEG